VSGAASAAEAQQVPRAKSRVFLMDDPLSPPSVALRPARSVTAG
jgi:hypothetical protein